MKQESNVCHFSPWTGCAPLHIETWQGVNKLIVGVDCKIEKAHLSGMVGTLAKNTLCPPYKRTAAEWWQIS